MSANIKAAERNAINTAFAWQSADDPSDPFCLPKDVATRNLSQALTELGRVYSKERNAVDSPVETTPVLPVPMVLNCPACGKRHIDAGAYATKPHRSHACQKCGVVWRPAIIATVGVQFLPGLKDEL